MAMDIIMHTAQGREWICVVIVRHEVWGQLGRRYGTHEACSRTC